MDSVLRIPLLFITLKSILVRIGFPSSFVDVCTYKVVENSSRHMARILLKSHKVMICLLAAHDANICLLWSVQCHIFYLISLWFCCFNWNLSIVEMYLVFLSIRRLWCVLWRKEILFRHESKCCWSWIQS